MEKQAATELVMRVLVEHEHKNPEGYHLSTTLEEFGATSLDIVEMVMMVEDKIQKLTSDPKFEFPDKATMGLKTFEDFVRMVETYGPAISIGTSSTTIQRDDRSGQNNQTDTIPSNQGTKLP